MSAVLTATAETNESTGIPLPVVTMNRSLLVGGVIIGFLLQQPLVTTALFVMLTLSLVFGPAGSLPYRLGSLIFGSKLQTYEKEGRTLMRFNNSIAVVLFGLAQIAFFFGNPVAGWAASLMVGVAATIALAGFCIGCVLYFQLNQMRARFSR